VKKLFLIFNHTLTVEQIKDAKDSLWIEEFVALPPDLQSAWGAVPPEIFDIKKFLRPIKEFIKNEADKEDYILVQGDFGACCEIVNFCKEIGITVVYSTNQRVSTETVIDGIVHKTSQFRHCIYRKY